MNEASRIAGFLAHSPQTKRTGDEKQNMTDSLKLYDSASDNTELFPDLDIQCDSLISTDELCAAAACWKPLRPNGVL
jgi:hypothetical protein